MIKSTSDLYKHKGLRERGRGSCELHHALMCSATHLGMNLGMGIKKQRHYFANKGPSSQGYGFPVVMYRCESWTIKEAERQRTDDFEVWCWRRLLRVP